MQRTPLPDATNTPLQQYRRSFL